MYYTFPTNIRIDLSGVETVHIYVQLLLAVGDNMENNFILETHFH
jgi:hypothetical protein